MKTLSLYPHVSLRFESFKNQTVLCHSHILGVPTQVKSPNVVSHHLFRCILEGENKAPLA